MVLLNAVLEKNEARNAFYLKYKNEERERVPIFKERERKFSFLK